MLNDKKMYKRVGQKYSKKIGGVALLVAFFAMLGIIGTIFTFQQQHHNNFKVNISGRQRFLSAMILLDLQKLLQEPSNKKLKESINQRRNLFKDALTTLELEEGKLVNELRSSWFANEKTPDSVDLHKESIIYYKATDPENINLAGVLPAVTEMQRQIIGAGWDAYTGDLADRNDKSIFRLAMFVVLCFSMVVSFTGYAIYVIFILDRENKENKFILKNSSKYVSLGEQTVNINHDMNNILSVMVTFISTFKTLIKDRPDLLQKFSVLEKSVGRLTALTAALRRSILGQAEEVNLESFSVADVVQDCQTILRDKLSSNSVDFISEVDEKFVVHMKKDFLYQLLLNLISNSIDAVANKDQAWVRVSAEEENGEVKISVTDSGNGLSAEVKDKLFTPFFTTKTNGSGLGLNYLRKMAEEMNAQLTYDDGHVNTRFVFHYRKSSERFSG